MKKILMIAMILFASFVAYAQDENLDEYSFETEPLKTEKTPYFAIGAGYTYSFMFLNYDELNTYAKKMGHTDEFDGVFYVGGIHGFTGLVVIPNLRLGFYGVSGSKLLEKETTENSTNYTLTSEMKLAMNGFNLDYGFVPFKSLAILPGVSFGWGRMEIESYKNESSVDWDDISKVDMTNNPMHRIEHSIMFVQPQLNIEYAVTNFAMLKLNLAYNLTFDSPLADNKWVYNNNSELKNAPKDLNANSFSAQIGLYLGLFNY